jgi:hypothetical protein
MKPLFFLMVFILLMVPLFAEGVLTQDDFVPPPPEEKELLVDLNLSDSQGGLYLSYGGVTVGSVCTFISLYSTFDAALSDPGGAEMQTGIILTGTSLIFTAFFSLLTESFRGEQQTYSSISEE